MASHRQKRLEMIRACSGEPLSTTDMAHRLGRGTGGDTTALAERLADDGDLARSPHPKRKDASLYQATPQGLDRLADDAAHVDPGKYLVLIAESAVPAAMSALATFVNRTPPTWMVRGHGRYRLIVAYDESRVADALEAEVSKAAGDAITASVLRVDRQEFPLLLPP